MKSRLKYDLGVARLIISERLHETEPSFKI